MRRWGTYAFSDLLADFATCAITVRSCIGPAGCMRPISCQSASADSPAGWINNIRARRGCIRNQDPDGDARDWRAAGGYQSRPAGMDSSVWAASEGSAAADGSDDYHLGGIDYQECLCHLRHDARGAR